MIGPSWAARLGLVWFFQRAHTWLHFSEGPKGGKLCFSDSHSGLHIETTGESKKYMCVLLVWAASWALEIFKFPWWFQRLRTFNERWGPVIIATQSEKRRHLDGKDFPGPLLQFYCANKLPGDLVKVQVLIWWVWDRTQDSTFLNLLCFQERIAKCHGTQCGFCTPGMVMSIYTLLRNHPEPSLEQLTEALGGRLYVCVLLFFNNGDGKRWS